MNNPLSKNKANLSPYAYIYRGIDVEVRRNYNFNCEYVVSSEYFVPSLGLFASTPKELKKKVDRRLDKETNWRDCEIQSKLDSILLSSLGNQLTLEGRKLWKT